MGMKQALVLGMTSAALIAALAGCSTAAKDTSDPTAESSAESSAEATAATTATEAATEAPAAAPGTGRVNVDNADLGEVTAVTCATDAGVTTITLASTPQATIVLTAEDTPSVKSVHVGELGAEGPAVAFIEGVTGAEAAATKAGTTYTVKGTGTGAKADDPSVPVDMPFEIAATCP